MSRPPGAARGRRRSRYSASRTLARSIRMFDDAHAMLLVDSVQGRKGGLRPARENASAAGRREVRCCRTVCHSGRRRS